MEYYNHKKAKENMQLLVETVTKEVKKGWVLVLPEAAHQHLPHSMICLMGIAKQFNYMFDSTTMPKNRITHDQTFCLLQGSKLVNTLKDLA
jgi:hypothetical protein